MSKKQPILHNPYLPSWEYVPDGEPHVFQDRVYVYGSHDRFNGFAYCLNDYVCWSAPVDNLGDWRYEGVIYRKTQDPLNPDGAGALYAPDVTVGPDGRYYLYYALSNHSAISVAVCDTPAGEYAFYGHVHYADGTLLGARETDDNQFDPAVLTEGERTYLYTGGVCFPREKKLGGAMCTVLDADMLTILEEPVFVVPSARDSAGTPYENQEFFEASSIRKFGGRYYFVYSSVHMNELCYAISDRPNGGFQYGGVIVSNCDKNIDTYKPAEKAMYFGGNNHGGLVEVNGEYYIFYHRHTNGTNYSRQGCMEKIQILPDGSIPQVEMTSCCGCEPFEGKGEYPAYLACNLFKEEKPLNPHLPIWMQATMPRITQDGRDGDEEIGYIAEISDGTTIGFKYFRFENVQKITIRTRGYIRGKFEIKTSWDGDVLGTVDGIGFTNIWKTYSAQVEIPDGVHALYFTFRGSGSGMLASFCLE